MVVGQFSSLTIRPEPRSKLLRPASSGRQALDEPDSDDDESERTDLCEGRDMLISSGTMIAT